MKARHGKRDKKKDRRGAPGMPILTSDLGRKRGVDVAGLEDGLVKKKARKGKGRRQRYADVGGDDSDSDFMP